MQNKKPTIFFTPTTKDSPFDPVNTSYTIYGIQDKPVKRCPDCGKELSGFEREEDLGFCFSYSCPCGYWKRGIKDQPSKPEELEGENFLFQYRSQDLWKDHFHTKYEPRPTISRSTEQVIKACNDARANGTGFLMVTFEEGELVFERLDSNEVKLNPK